jgi:hypothetical protein
MNPTDLFSPSANLAESTCESFEAAGKFCTQYFSSYQDLLIYFAMLTALCALCLILMNYRNKKNREVLMANKILMDKIVAAGGVPQKGTGLIDVLKGLEEKNGTDKKNDDVPDMQDKKVIEVQK